MKKLIITLTLVATATFSMANDTLDALHRSAYNGNIQSQYLYGDALIKSGQSKKGIQAIEVSAINGYEKAQRFLAEYHLKENDPKAAAWFQKSFLSNNPSSAYVLSVIYHDGTLLGRDFKKAYAWMDQSSRKGFLRANYKLAQMNLLGYGIAKDEEKAISLLKSSVENDDNDAKLLLALYYLSNQQNETVAYKYIEELATETGNAIASYIYDKNKKAINNTIKLVGSDDSGSSGESVTLMNKKKKIDPKIEEYYYKELYKFDTIEEALKL